MTKRSRCGEKGTSFIEFTLVGTPLILIMVSIIEMSLAMWTYVTLAYAVREGSRYAATRGQGCNYTNNSCATTVAGVSRRIAAAGIGLDPGKLIVKFSASDGTTISCNPLSSCYTNSASWPPSTANSEVTSLTPAASTSVSGKYPIAIIFVSLLGLSKVNTGNVQASTKQLIQF